jgi:hypothetical protein
MEVVVAVVMVVVTGHSIFIAQLHHARFGIRKAMTTRAASAIIFKIHPPR